MFSNEINVFVSNQQRIQSHLQFAVHSHNHFSFQTWRCHSLSFLCYEIVMAEDFSLRQIFSFFWSLLQNNKHQINEKNEDFRIPKRNGKFFCSNWFMTFRLPHFIFSSLTRLKIEIKTKAVQCLSFNASPCDVIPLPFLNFDPKNTHLTKRSKKCINASSICHSYDVWTCFFIFTLLRSFIRPKHWNNYSWKD